MITADSETVLHGVKDHKELRTLKLEGSYDAFGRDYIHLRQLLSHNRDITVTDYDGRLHTDRNVIDKLYSLNRFYRGSACLLTEPLWERSWWRPL